MTLEISVVIMKSVWVLLETRAIFPPANKEYQKTRGAYDSVTSNSGNIPKQN